MTRDGAQLLAQSGSEEGHSDAQRSGHLCLSCLEAGDCIDALLNRPLQPFLSPGQSRSRHLNVLAQDLHGIHLLAGFLELKVVSTRSQVIC